MSESFKECELRKVEYHKGEVTTLDVKCHKCREVLPEGSEAIYNNDSLSFFCSWDCVSDWHDYSERSGQAMAKKERENALDVQDRKWPNKEKWGQ